VCYLTSQYYQHYERAYGLLTSSTTTPGSWSRKIILCTTVYSMQPQRGNNTRRSSHATERQHGLGSQVSARCKSTFTLCHVPIRWCGRKFVYDTMFVLTRSNRSPAYCMMMKGKEPISLSFFEPGRLKLVISNNVGDGRPTEAYSCREFHLGQNRLSLLLTHPGIALGNLEFPNLSTLVLRCVAVNTQGGHPARPLAESHGHVPLLGKVSLQKKLFALERLRD
jgi:hypothetical protein